MSQTNIVVTQLAQLGMAERTAQELQGHPETTRQAAQQAAPEALKRERDTIEQTEDSEGARGVKAKKEGGGGGRDSRRQKRRKGEPPPEEAESAFTAPWAGNIVNLKI